MLSCLEDMTQVLAGLCFSLCGEQITQSHIFGLNGAPHVPVTLTGTLSDYSMQGNCKG